MRIALERHAYAPEMNKAHILDKRGRLRGSIPAPHCKSIRDVRLTLFLPVTPARLAIVQVERDGTWAGINGTYRGRYDLARGYQVIREHAAAIKARHKGGRLVDGTHLPDARVHLSTRLSAISPKVSLLDG